jgi:hypothetical protein
MRDYLIHLAYNLSPLDIISLMVGAFFIGVFLTIIIRLKKESINWIGSSVKPWRRDVVVGYKGSVPVYDLMYSTRFVRHIYEKNKGYQARLSALKQIGGEE